MRTVAPGLTGQEASCAYGGGSLALPPRHSYRGLRLAEGALVASESAEASRRDGI